MEELKEELLEQYREVLKTTRNICVLKRAEAKSEEEFNYYCTKLYELDTQWFKVNMLMNQGR